jgi:ferredoxin
MGCGLCAEHCPNGALSLFIDPEKPLPLDLDLLKQELPAPPGGDSNEQGI